MPSANRSTRNSNGSSTQPGASAAAKDFVAPSTYRLAAECSLATLSDLRWEALERWLANRAEQGVSAKDRNHYRGALVAFCNWCVATHRLTDNPFNAIPKANEKAVRRRQCRAMDESELIRLL